MHHGRHENIHLAEDRQDRVLWNVRLFVLFVRMPGQRLPLRAEQLSMWLPDANRRTLSRLFPAHRIPVSGTEADYRLAACLRHPHWQLICTQRQALAWHPHVQEEQSQLPQQPVLAIFCEVDVFVSAMVVSSRWRMIRRLFRINAEWG